MRGSDLQVVHTTQGLLQAQAIKAYLESCAIPATLSYESAGPAIGITVDGLGEVRILVRARQARRARRCLLTQRRFQPQRRRALRRRRSTRGRSRGRRRAATSARRR